MKALISDKEIANFLVTTIANSFSDADIETALSLEYNEQETGNEILNIIEKRDAGKIDKFKDKLKGKLRLAVDRDLRAHIEKLQNFLKIKFQSYPPPHQVVFFILRSIYK